MLSTQNSADHFRAPIKYFLIDFLETFSCDRLTAKIRFKPYKK
ncbi:hypothetical Protein YC6258_05882 [Gynuella sunshinyii YC6258]|uniref:Uncharacterized protein n=1 Tax=Gynuella sunshinyii YC6258 TaxID=1445510 RepID=A0A0C5VF64_9GAMM|nr:hypothetical Protein YC6258_05882 [Gynuella sunshinyii YC6258]